MLRTSVNRHAGCLSGTASRGQIAAPIFEHTQNDKHNHTCYCTFIRICLRASCACSNLFQSDELRRKTALAKSMRTRQIVQNGGRNFIDSPPYSPSEMIR